MAEGAAEASSDPLVVVILGCTGTGKSKLAIEIAKETEGEIISADSMQVYKGLDIITNKVTKEEQSIIPHHMINIVEANEQFSVVQFQAMALPMIDDIIKRQKVPIIIGGTNYYIESLLWENLIEEVTDQNTDEGDCVLEHTVADDESESVFPRKQDDGPGANLQQPSQDPLSLYEKLATIDPAMAQKHHPNDTRKIKRSIQVFEQRGITHSQLVAQQHAQEGATAYGGPMRFTNVCVLWLRCDLKTLDPRLDARVDKMIEHGLVEELVEFHNLWKSVAAGKKVENREGIFQSIGFKEFREFLNLEDPQSKVNGELFSKCVDSMKCATRRYARKQIKWVANRFLGRPSSCAPDVYGLEAADLEKWESCVLEKGLGVVRKLMAGEKVVEPPLGRIDSNTASKHSRHTCDVCNDRPIIGDKNWSMHLRSRSHGHYKKRAKISKTTA